MSEVLSTAPTFFSLYSAGLVSAEQIDDYVGTWHDSGDDEQRPLAEYLGLTDFEYGVWFLTPRALPLILQARREGQPLANIMASYHASLCENADPEDRAIIFSLGHWLKANPPA